MKHLAVILCILSVSSGANAAPKPMNVLMLIADDLNSWLLENPERYTGKVIAPNLKGLAESGVNFKYAYTAAPVCSPSRTAFFSGVAPWKSGIYNNAQTISKSEALNHDAVLHGHQLSEADGASRAPSRGRKIPTCQSSRARPCACALSCGRRMSTLSSGAEARTEQAVTSPAGCLSSL